MRWGGRAPWGGDGPTAPPLRFRAGPGARRPGCPRGSWHACLTALSSRRPSRSASSVLPSALPGLPSSPPLPGQPVCLLGQPPCLPFPSTARPELPAAGQEELGERRRRPLGRARLRAWEAGTLDTWGCRVPAASPGRRWGKMKQQPLLSARVKCDRKIGEAAGGGGGGTQLGSAGRGVPWQRGFRPHPPTPHRHHQAPGADVLGSRGEVVIPTQPLPERARIGPGGIAQAQFSVILRAERQPKGSTGQSGQAAQRRRQFQGCRAASGVQPCVLWRREDGSSGPGIQLQRGTSECPGEGAAL